MKAPIPTQFDEIRAFYKSSQSSSKPTQLPFHDKYTQILSQNKFYSEALDLWISLNEEKQNYLISILKKHNMQLQKYQMFRERVRLREGTYRSIIREFFACVQDHNVSSAKIEELYNSIDTLWDGAQEISSNGTQSQKMRERIVEARNALVEHGMGFLVRAIQERHQQLEMQIKKKSGMDSAEAQKALHEIIEKNVRLTSQLQFSQMVEKQNLANVFRGEFSTDLLLDDGEVDQMLFMAESKEKQMHDKLITRLRERKKIAQQLRKRKNLEVSPSPKQRLQSAKRKSAAEGGAQFASDTPSHSRSRSPSFSASTFGSSNGNASHTRSRSPSVSSNQFANNNTNGTATSPHPRQSSSLSVHNNTAHNGPNDPASTPTPSSPSPTFRSKSLIIDTSSATHLSLKSPKSTSVSPRANSKTPKSARRSARSSRRQTPESDHSIDEYDVDESINNGNFEEELALHMWDYQHDVHAQRDEAEEKLRNMEEAIAQQEVVLRREQNRLNDMQANNDDAHRKLIEQMTDLERNDMASDEKKEHIRNVTVQLLQNKREKNNISTTVTELVGQEEEKLLVIKNEYFQLKKQISVMNERAKVYEEEQISETEAEISFKRLKSSPDSHYVVCFTDIMSSTSLWEHNTEDMAMALQMHDKVIRSILRETDGIELKVVGDAFVVVWLGADCHKAVQAAINMQLRLLQVEWPATIYEHPSGKQEYDGDGNLIYSGLRVRVALHYGKCILTRDPITNRPDLFGSTMNEGARIEPKCEGGEIIMSKQLLEQLAATPVPEEFAAEQHSYTTKRLGSYQMKGLKQEMELHRVVPMRVVNRFFSGQRLQPMRDYDKEYEKLKRELLEMMDAMTLQFANVEASLEAKEEHIAELERQLEFLKALRQQHAAALLPSLRSGSDSSTELDATLAPLRLPDSSPRESSTSHTWRRDSVHNMSDHTLSRQSSLANLFLMHKKLLSQYKRHRPQEPLELLDGGNGAGVPIALQISPMQGGSPKHGGMSPLLYGSAMTGNSMFSSHIYDDDSEDNNGENSPDGANAANANPTHFFSAHQQLTDNIRKLRKTNQQLIEEKDEISDLLRKTRTELDQLRQAFASYKYQQEEVSRRTVDQKTPQTPIDRKNLKNLSPLASISPAFRKKEKVLNERVSSSLRMSFDLMMKTKSNGSPGGQGMAKRRPLSPLRRPSLFSSPAADSEQDYFADLRKDAPKEGGFVLLASSAPVVSGNGGTGGIFGMKR